MLDLDMSPYGPYVWSAWAVSVAALAGVVAATVAGARRWRRDLEAAEAEAGRASPEDEA
jgi:heme exporter protein D